MKPMQYYVNIIWGPYFLLDKRKLERVQSYVTKLKLSLSKHQCRSDYFSVGVINHWNQLPDEVVNCTSRNCFKFQIDNYFSKVQVFVVNKP